MSIARSLRFTLAYAVLALSTHSFAASIELTNLKTFPVPFGPWVNQVAINDNGDIAGTSFSATTGEGGFLIPANSAPLQIVRSGARYTAVTGVNNQGVLVGYYFGNDGVFHGFSYSTGAYTLVDIGPLTYVLGINNHGDMTGYYASNTVPAVGFLITAGTQTTFSVPGHPLDTYATSVNDSDQVVGNILTPTSGFLRESNGSFQSLDFLPRGINDGGIIVGNGAGPNSTPIGMLRIGGTEFTFAIPGALDTYISGVNNENEIVGYYRDANSGPYSDHIFTAQIPVAEPTTASLCAVVLIGGMALVCRRRA